MIQFHGDMEAIQPSKPYMHGFMDRENHFYPDGLLVSLTWYISAA